MKSKIFVFIGKPGCGKTTLISHVFSKGEIIDVLPFVKAFEKNGIVPERKTRLAYHKMYDSIKQIKKFPLIIEIGTNHAELNIKELAKLRNNYKLEIFLCDAKIDVCRERAIKRGRNFDKLALERRLRRNFPKTHIDILKKENITYHMVDMEREIDKNISIIKKYL